MKTIKTILRPKTFLQKIVKVFVYGIAALAILLIMLTCVFLVKKDDISKKILLQANSYFSGEVQFDNIHLNFFSMFPSTSLTLTNLKFFEEKNDSTDSTRQPIAELKEIHVAVNLIDLLKNHVNIKAIRIEDGEVNLVQYDNKSYNFLNAIEPVIPVKETTESIDKPKPQKKHKILKEEARKDSLKVRPKKKPVKKQPEEQPPDIDLTLNRAIVKNVVLNYFSEPENSQSSVHIERLYTSYTYHSDSIQCELKTSTEIRSLQISDELTIDNKFIRLETNFIFDLKMEMAQISYGKLGLGEAFFDLEGMIGFRDNKPVDLIIDGYDNDLSVLNLFLTQSGIKNLKKGEIDFSCTIMGNMNEGIPEIDLSFAVQDMVINIPNSKSNISNLNTNGTFRSGINPEFSGASLIIDTLYAKLPEGHINAGLSVKNLIDPDIEYSLNLESKLDGFDKIFKLDFLQDLKGKIEISDTYHGQYFANKGWKDRYYGNLSIILDELSFNIPDVMEISNLSGIFSGDPDTLKVQNFILLTGNTDIRAEGDILNATEIFLDRKREIRAALNVNADTYDLPEFLKFDPRIGESFPYKIKDIVMDLEISTSHKKLTEFNVVPEIRFDFNSLYAVIDQFLPPIQINLGEFILGEIGTILHLDFNDLDIQIAGSELNAEYDFYHPLSRSDSMRINIDAINLNPGKLLYFNNADSIPGDLDALTNGYFNCDIELPPNRDKMFSVFDFSAESFSYLGREDTIMADYIGLTAKNVNYSRNTLSNPLAGLSAQIELAADSMKSSWFKFDNVHYSISAEQGIYTIIPQKVYWYGQKGSGQYIISPFSNPPHYNIKYSIQQFPLEVLIESFQGESSITGLADLEVDISFEGDDTKSIMSSLNGSTRLIGNDLTIHGVDLDEVINNFERSQSFNLVDVGAVAVAGPYGLAISKGSDYAILLVSGMGDSTHISQINTSFKISDGLIETEDVAFATNNYRVAVTGWIDLPSDSLDIQVGVLNEKGCNVISQTIFGDIKNPEQSKVKVLKTLFAPVTNLLEAAVDIECEVVYEGSVSHPEQ